MLPIGGILKIEMRIISIYVLDEAIKAHPEAKKQLDIWRSIVEEAVWKTPHQLKAQLGKATILSGNRVVFDIKGNHFRLLTKIDYQKELVLVSDFGTHEEYDNWKL